jgi:NAD(P)-dependent dehydrogenase (short-subunit alcohol dehydrogenase family)
MTKFPSAKSPKSPKKASQHAPLQSVLITGCSSGIGAATARRLARSGWRVYATARRVEAIADLKAAGCEILPLDVADHASARAAIDAMTEREGGIGVLVNNAGYSQSGALETLSLDDVRRQFETNVYGPLRLAQLVLPGMRARGYGKIVNVSSMGGKLTFPGGGAYHASKHALEAMSDAMRFEVRGFGIDVIVIEPGLIRTGFAEAAGRMMPQTASVGPYAASNAAVERATRDVYERGPLASLGGPPDAVAKAIARAIRSKRPKARYAVTPSADLLLMQRRLMSDAAWDGVLRGTFPSPGSD